MNSITDLAEHIVLDDVNDTFYRTLCFSNFSRSIHDPKTEFEQQLDTTISNKLSRQLNWSSSVCSLDNATHKITHFIALYLQGKLDKNELNRLKQDNYWLAAAIDQELSESQSQNLFCDSPSGCNITAEASAVVWRYFTLQLSEPLKFVAEQVQLFSHIIVEMGCEKGNANINEEEMHHLAFLNAYPFLVLLMLLDKTVQSAKQELLNKIGFECETSRTHVSQYQPCAELVLSFLIFDEFVKYHVHDHISGNIETNLGVDISNAEEEAKTVFLQARTKAILNSLADIPVLTAEQRASFANQVGIKAEVKPTSSDSYSSLIKKLMPSKYQYNLSTPV